MKISIQVEFYFITRGWNLLHVFIAHVGVQWETIDKWIIPYHMEDEIIILWTEMEFCYK
jgi:hypothetical protein